MAIGGAGMQVLRSGRNSGRLAMVACALLVLVIVWQLARLAWLFVPADDASLAAPLRSAGTAPATPAVAVSKWHLFGAPPQRAAAAGPGAPMTTLALSLRGTLAESDPRSGLAVIAGADGSERAEPPAVGGQGDEHGLCIVGVEDQAGTAGEQHRAGRR